MKKSKSDPTLLADVRKYGKFDTNACLQCGSCTISCDLTKDDASFPRRTMRYVLFGLKDKLLSSLAPWLCYYCGDCSVACPRETEPGEAMMTLRRYLTAQYDCTGFSGKVYRSNLWLITALIISAAFMTLLCALFHGPIVTDHVELNTFASPHLVHLFDMTVAGLVFILLFFNAFRMYWFTLHSGSGFKISNIIKSFKENGFGFTMHNGEKVKIPLFVFLTEAKSFVVHLFTQKLFLSCKKKSLWIKHFLLVTGYLMMFVLVVIFIEWFQTDEIFPIYHPQRWLGYYAAAVLIYFTAEFIVGRIRKREEIHKFSDLTDWMFLILLLAMAATGMAVHIFRYLGFPLATYYAYVVHLIIAFVWLVVIVPFCKWTHLLYRSLGIYFQSVKERALEHQVPEKAILEKA